LKKIRVVVYTNVLVSGIISPHGPPRKILDLAIKETIEIVTSNVINIEVLKVLHREHIYNKYHLTEETIDSITSFLYEGTIMTSDELIIVEIKDDPEDNKFLACAIEGRADYIVSGDKHLLSLKVFRGIKILNPKDFLEIIDD